MNTAVAFGIVLIVSVLTPQGVEGQCSPGINCKLPDCRCWNDPNIPGGLAAADVPQMVIVSFQYGVNRANADTYTSLFDGITNPNKCQPKGTFFVTEENTDFNEVYKLFTNKHEIGITTPSGRVPQSDSQWRSDFATIKAELAKVGIPANSITGTRGPQLHIGGNEQFDSIEENKLTYDSTCVSHEYIDKVNLLWPYTYDFAENTPHCTIGETPSKSYAGKWEFLVANIQHNGSKCAVPSACSPWIKDSLTAFDFLFDAFSLHYRGPTKAPFILFIDPAWLTVDYQRQGTNKFLEFIRKAYDDTWIVTHSQALEWIRNPVNSSTAESFQPWLC